MPQHTVTEQGKRTIERSQDVSPSPKQKKSPGPVFGPSSQFKGVGRGIPGDLRK